MANTWKDVQHQSLEKCKSMTVKYHYTTNCMVTVKKANHTKCWQICGESGTLNTFK